VELVGLGTFLMKGQDPLNGISRVRISGAEGELSIEAEFGAVRKLVKYMTLFIGGMAVFFSLFFGIMFYDKTHPARWFVQSLAPFLPWPVLLPVISIFLKFRTSRALDVLLNNMAIIGKQQ